MGGLVKTVKRKKTPKISHKKISRSNISKKMEAKTKVKVRRKEFSMSLEK